MSTMVCLRDVIDTDTIRRFWYSGQKWAVLFCDTYAPGTTIYLCAPWATAFQDDPVGCCLFAVEEAEDGSETWQVVDDASILATMIAWHKEDMIDTKYKMIDDDTGGH